MIIPKRITYTLTLLSILLLTSCNKETINIEIDASDIESIELIDKFGSLFKTDLGNFEQPTFKLSADRYSDFLSDIRGAEKLRLRKLLVCYSIDIRTKSNKEIRLRGRGNLITITPDDIYYQIDKDLIKEYWDIEQEDFCSIPIQKEQVGITTPIIFNSSLNIDVELPQVKDSTFSANILQKVPGLSLLGSLFETDKIHVIIGIVPSDSGSPLIVTFDKAGNKIESHYCYETAGADMGFYSTNMVTINPDKTILFKDSTTTRKINEEGDDEIEGSDSLSISNKKYRITESGKFEKIN